MEVTTAAPITRRSTRIRVQIPISVTSLDRVRPFAERCDALVVSAQGCGFRSSRALQIGTPIFLSDLPGGNTVTGRVASCLPLGKESKHFLIGAALYTHGNVWGIANPPADWNVGSEPATNAAAAASAPSSSALPAKKSWPYNLFSDNGEAHPGKK